MVRSELDDDSGDLMNTDKQCSGDGSSSGKQQGNSNCDGSIHAAEDAVLSRQFIFRERPAVHEELYGRHSAYQKCHNQPTLLVGGRPQQNWRRQQRERQVHGAANASPLAPLGVLIPEQHDSRQFARPRQSRNCRQCGHDQQEPCVDAKPVVQGSVRVALLADFSCRKSRSLGAKTPHKTQKRHFVGTPFAPRDDKK